MSDETSPTKKRGVTSLGIVITAVLAVVLVVGGLYALNGFSFDTSCAHQAQAFLDQIQPLAREWDDATALAGQTPRGSLSPRIDSLQAIRRKVQDLKPPECAKAVQTNLVASMDATIQGFLDFLAQKPDSTVTASFTRAKGAMDDFGKSIQALR